MREWWRQLPQRDRQGWLRTGAVAVAVTAISLGIWNLPVDAWIRGFLIVSAMFLVTSSFTLAKVVRDAQETAAVNARIDQARVEKMLAEHDPFATP